MVFEPEYCLMEVEFLISHSTSEHFCQLLVTVDHVSIVRILESIGFNILPESSHNLQSGNFFNATQNSRKLRRNPVSLGVVFEAHNKLDSNRGLS